MSAKKRNSSQRSGQRRGVSGNPRRRAEQLQEKQRRSAAPSDPATRDLAFRMAGGATPAPWWPESHRRVLAQARAASWPDRHVELEDLTCQIVGGELHDCLRRHGNGHHPAQWLVALTEAAGATLRSALDGGAEDTASGDWRGLWSLLCGIALTAPKTPGDPRDGATLLARRYFPDIKDPQAAALAEADEAARLLADRRITAPPPAPGGGCRAAGTALVARDDYGSRFLLAAPFGYDGEDGETAGHWYAWDIDACWLDAVVGAGTFASAEEALADWRDAVGSAASRAELVASPPDLTERLLTQSLPADAFWDAVRGDEPLALLEEHYRQRRRARELVESLGGLPAGTGAFMVDMDKARDEFLAWYAARHGPGAVSPGMADAVDTITDQWGPHKDIDDRGFYACSPHRIEVAARLIRNGDYQEHAAPAIRLLPDWTQWCAERNGLVGDSAARAREAAVSATALADASAAVPDYPQADPVRRPE